MCGYQKGRKSIRERGRKEREGGGESGDRKREGGVGGCAGHTREGQDASEV